ncbi:hypothetical protein H0H93_005435 [Arthromyces matolae]|nr:hypothetical protein H0H93_005435 [Arthromyces matolae]
MKTALLHFPVLAILLLAWLVGASPILTSDALAIRDPSTSILTPTLGKLFHGSIWKEPHIEDLVIVIRQDPSDSSSPSGDPTASSSAGTVGDSSTGDTSTTAPQQPLANPQQTSGTSTQHLSLWQILRHPIQAVKVAGNNIMMGWAKMHLDERQKNFPSDTASIAALQAKIKMYQDKVAKHKSHMT